MTTGMSNRQTLLTTPYQVIDLGRMAYAEAWALQRDYAAQRGADVIPNTLLFVEHPHTYTLGTKGDAANILLSPAALAARGITVHQVDRGGDVTYHGLGQLVGYPILKLPPGGDGLHADVVGYVRWLESILITALASFGIHGQRLAGYTGVWVEQRGELAKIAAIGVRVTTRRVTMHGFALNVDPDLSYFQGIVPCGISDKPVTSLAALLEQPPTLTAAAAVVAAIFAAEGGKSPS
ncbi:MAG TPA: lipoyl(octanoyl) transferase LipB [Aggregatilineales bacterium]|nr:lipoyl(octanoyl) transferase LipB [Anaerolineales bacterium]HRE46259.1 lipoyl(octanoyl) transferase LipB [Aggregatilineales bacterium]